MSINTGGETAITLQTANEDDTRAVAARLAAALTGGEVIGLRGDLGAGKTVFVQGLACGLGACEPATSPSFVIVHHHPGRLHLFHVDLYRLTTGEVEELGLEELIAPDAVVAIEWSERLPARLRGALWLEVALAFGPGERERTLTLRIARAGESDLAQRISRALLPRPVPNPEAPGR